MEYLEFACRTAIGVVFVVSVWTKLKGAAAFGEFVGSLRQMDVLPAALVRPSARAVVAAELAIPVLLVVPFTAGTVGGFALAAGLLAAFGVAILISLSRGQRAPCRCFGRSTTPLGPRHVVRNGLLIILCVLGLAASLAGGSAPPAALGVAAVAGLVLGVLFTVLDDLVELFRPLPVR